MHDATTMELLPMTIPTLARKIGWSAPRLRRLLVARHLESDGNLLVNVGRGRVRPRWTVTLAAIKALAPQWFFDPDATQRQIEWLSGEVDGQRETIEVLSRRVALQHQRLVALARRDQRPTAGR